ncbi:hypothetical protein QEI_2928, partial [Clostridioides difficile CD129]
MLLLIILVLICIFNYKIVIKSSKLFLILLQNCKKKEKN